MRKFAPNLIFSGENRQLSKFWPLCSYPVLVLWEREILVTHLFFVCETAIISKLGWIKKNFQERWQRVRVGHEFSSESKVLRGIPQGSILGPTLFTVVINDLPDYEQKILVKSFQTTRNLQCNNWEFNNTGRSDYGIGMARYTEPVF